MKTNKIKLTLITVLAQILCISVVLAQVHAKDTVSMISNPYALNKSTSKDIVTKALAELHSHTDKTSLKNIHASSSSAARVRRLDALQADEDLPITISTVFHDFLLRLRVVASLCYQYA